MSDADFSGMRIADALAGVSRLFLDTAPVIYFVERNPQFVDLVDPIFERLEADITAVASNRRYQFSFFKLGTD